jgi:hypothetical protein
MKLSMEGNAMSNALPNPALAGVLAVVRTITNHGDADTLVVEPIDLDALEPGQGEDEIFTNNLLGALNFVRKSEADNLSCDLGIVSREMRQELEADLEKVKVLSWGEPNASGHYVIDSVWAGGELKEGFQWRFLPVAL